MTSFEEWLAAARRMKPYDPEAAIDDHLVTTSHSARWLDPEMTGNPAQIGVLLDVPARSMEFYLQQLGPGVAGDLQRHRHESVHFVIEGDGHTEIGPRTVTWHTGDLIYTPPWVWHRHYNDGTVTARMLLVENSRLLEALGLNERESAGEIAYAQRPR
jgi:mannose-6-phosphate isomerase-like protein (cupin superfamily)